MRRTIHRVIGGSSHDKDNKDDLSSTGGHTDDDPSSPLPFRPGPSKAFSSPDDVPQSTDRSSKPRAASSGFTDMSFPSGSPQTGASRLNRAYSTMTTGTSLDLAATTGSDGGLHLIQDAEYPAVDLILVHGLGGSWIKTWSYKHDPQMFWPAWLPSEEPFDRLRIFSFGYNANFKGASTSLGILDFAKDLLFKMSTYGNQGGRIGQFPIMFVAHSMGGLVVKQAYVLGTLDDSFVDMISSVFGTIFLSTPHKGSDFARTLNNVLSASLIMSTKVYIAELERSSPTLQAINEQFRLVCQRLRLVSFYETEKTSVGGSKKMIVDKDSGVLGYPSEVSSSMEADHHNVCKFDSPDNANYIALRDTIRGWLLKYGGQKQSNNENDDVEDMEQSIMKLTQILGVAEMPDLTAGQVMEGTCHWIEKTDKYRSWTEPSFGMLNVLWLTGLPGTGKSSLSRHIVGSLRREDADVSSNCQSHFFTFTDARARKTTYALRCIAFQLALSNSAFRKTLLGLHERTGFKLDQQDMQVIWFRIFEGIIFKMNFETTLYWVFDGLDEADSPVPFLNALLAAKPKSPIKVFLAGRPAPTLINLATSELPCLSHMPLVQSNTKEDIDRFIKTRIHGTLPLGEAMKRHVAAQMCTRASGSFLWAKMALARLEQAWHTEEDIHAALDEVPEGMQALFDRMLGNIKLLETTNPRNFFLAQRILAWTTCSTEPLTTSALSVALQPEFKKLQNLEATILHLCGHFLSTTGSKITLIHETAKSYLLSHHDGRLPFLNGPDCHRHLATVCINYLGDESWKLFLLKIHDSSDESPAPTAISKSRMKLLLAEHPFLSYAVSHWAYHVRHADARDDDLHGLLQDFFDQHILSWIHACIVLEGLRGITRTARHIKAYARKRNSGQLLRTSSSLSLSADDLNFFHLWSVDLIRIVGKFGRNLSQKPSSIYRIVPPMCPHGSMMYKTYSLQSNMLVRGVSSQGWDDCLARLPIGRERSLSKILCTVTYFICLVAIGGEIIVSQSETCEEIRRMNHGEYVRQMAVNRSGSLLATAGIDTFRVWDLSTGEELHRIPNSTSASVMAVSFGSVDSELIIGYDNCMVVCYDVSENKVAWEFLAEMDDEEYHPCPKAMVLSPDVSKLAIVFRGRPVLIWDIFSRDGKPITLVRESDLAKQSDDAWDQLDSIIWCPDGLSIMVLYQDTTIVRFFLTEEKAVENGETLAREMVISHDGNLILTSDNGGTLSLWSLPKFHLVYRLPHEEFVRDLAFSPDSQRFYDIRGAICNVWEPDVLLRHDGDDHEETSSNDKSDTAYSGPIVSHSGGSRVQITSLDYGPFDKYCICGRDDGSVTLQDLESGESIRKLYSHANTAAVIALSWSPTGKYVASSDDNGRIVTKRLAQKDDGTWAVFPCLDFRDEDPAYHFVFNPTEKIMLISFAQSDRAWNLKTKTEIWRHQRDHGLGLRWINHPLKKNLLLCIEHDKTTTHEWIEQDNTAAAPNPPTSVGRPSPTPSLLSVADLLSSAHVRHVAVSENKKSIIAEILPGISPDTRVAGQQLRLDVLHTESLRRKAGYSMIPQELDKISRFVRRFLGCYKDYVVFLNHEFWVCTWPLGAAYEAPKTHFFLPRDCIDPSSLGFVTLAEGGTILFTKNGEIVVVQNGLRL